MKRLRRTDRVTLARTRGFSRGVSGVSLCLGLPGAVELWMSVAGVKLRGMKAGRRFRAELTEAQVQLAQQTADVCRAVWNAGLEQRREYRRRGAWINYEKQAQELVEAKKGTLLAYRSAVALPAAGAP